MFTGLYTHQTGLMGLCHRGWEFDDDAVELAQYLRDGDYRTHLFGHQHETGGDPHRLGYQSLHSQDNHHCDAVSRSLIGFLASREAHGDTPWFACAGFTNVHRTTPWPQETSFAADNIEVPPYLPDNAASRGEFARFHQCIENMDAAVGRILDALRTQPFADNTLVIFTTDHGIGMPRAKSTFYDPDKSCCP